MSRHHLFNPEGLPAATGFSYGALAAGGRTLHIAGVTGQQADLSFHPSMVDQYATACRAVATVIAEAGGEPSDLVSMTIYTTTVSEYKANLGPIGEAYRGVFGRHYPAMALIGVNALYDKSAKVELVCVAVIPGRHTVGRPGQP